MPGPQTQHKGVVSLTHLLIQAPKPAVEEPSKGIWGGLVSYFKTPKEEVPEPWALTLTLTTPKEEVPNLGP